MAVPVRYKEVSIGMSSVLTVPATRQSVLADLVPGSLVRDGFLVISGAGMVGLLAQIAVHLSFTPVPITGQTLGVLVCGTALGWRRGGLAMVIYGIAGVAGVPWFAGHQSGYVGATFGYIVGFVLCAALCGALAERGADRSVRSAIPAMVAGEIVTYVMGVAWLAVSLHVGLGKAIALGFTPFIIGDAVKTAFAAALLPAAWRVVRKR
jgi:biotin transport system substrate-specific component